MELRDGTDSTQVAAAQPLKQGPEAVLDRERRLLLSAGEESINENGFARATIADVASRAKLGLDVAHRHFASMDALLRALSGMFVQQMETVIGQATQSGIWKGAPARDVVEVAVRSVLDVVIDRAGLVRAFLAQGATDPSLSADLRRTGTHLSQRLIAVMSECSNVPARPSRAIAFSLLVSVALAHHYVLVGDEWSGTAFSRYELAEETSRLVCAYLGLQPTIGLLEDSADSAPTGMIEALRGDDRFPRG